MFAVSLRPPLFLADKRQTKNYNLCVLCASVVNIFFRPFMVIQFFNGPIGQPMKRVR